MALFKSKKMYIKKFSNKNIYYKKAKFGRAPSSIKLPKINNAQKGGAYNKTVLNDTPKILSGKITAQTTVKSKLDTTAAVKIKPVQNKTQYKRVNIKTPKLPKVNFDIKSAKNTLAGAAKKILPKAGLVLAIAILATAVVFAVKSGWTFIEKQNSEAALKKEADIKALSVVYAPEDYIYPQPSDEARKAADDYRNSLAENEYIPSEGEVTGIYKNDNIKTCYLTFDDGPSPVTNQILDILNTYGIKATFFAVGNQVRAYPEIVARIFNEGHSIGNHSYSHDYSSVYRGDADFNDEVITTRNAIDDALGGSYTNYVFRFPGGSFEDEKQHYKQNLISMKYQYIDWNTLSGDSEVTEPTGDYIINDIIKSTNDGTKEDIVVLMHDAGAKQITADTLPSVIDYLIQKGYTFKAIWNNTYASENGIQQ